jgi:hypothetical protein
MTTEVLVVDRGVDRDAQVKDDFLAEFIRTHSRMSAMARAGVPSLRAVEQWIQNDPEFKARYAEAQALLADQMEAAAFQRGVTGVERPVFHMGGVVGYQTEYSDTLLVKLLQAKLPEQYGTARHTLDVGVFGGDMGPMPSPMTLEEVHEAGREFGQILARRAGERVVDSGGGK